MNPQTYAEATSNCHDVSDTHPSEPRHHSGHQCAAHSAAASEMQVWINFISGVYHFPGQRWSGKTKIGKYMSSEIARKSGRPTRNGQ